MSRRLVCCPVVGDEGAVSFRYLFVDSVRLIVDDVTENLAVIDGNLEGACCLESWCRIRKNVGILLL